MRSYPTNSPQAAARIVALTLLADGHVDGIEMDALDLSGKISAIDVLYVSRTEGDARGWDVSEPPVLPLFSFDADEAHFLRSNLIVQTCIFILTDSNTSKVKTNYVVQDSQPYKSCLHVHQTYKVRS